MRQLHILPRITNLHKWDPSRLERSWTQRAQALRRYAGAWAATIIVAEAGAQAVKTFMFWIESSEPDSNPHSSTHQFGGGRVLSGISARCITAAAAGERRRWRARDSDSGGFHWQTKRGAACARHNVWSTAAFTARSAKWHSSDACTGIFQANGVERPVRVMGAE